MCFNPLMHVALKNNLRTLVKSFGMQHISEYICIRNTRCSGPNLQVSFKYFVNLYLIFKSLKSDKLEILHAKEQLENILMRTLPRTLLCHFHFQSYCQMYHRSSQQFEDELSSINGLSFNRSRCQLLVVLQA